jgi:glutamine---fructose-6-phosphate transaminase (isomerizing)
MTRDSLYAKTQSALQQIQARKGQPIIIANDSDVSLASDVSRRRRRSSSDDR